MLVLGVLSAGCGRIIYLDETTFGRLEIAPVESCEEEAELGSRLAGVHIRQADASESFEMFALSGVAREAKLPRTLQINEQKSRLIATTDQEPDATRNATAAPRRDFSDGETLPAVYDLSYRSDDLNFAGPLVVGNAAVASELPSTGRKVYRGLVQLSGTTFTEDGFVSITTANARFAAVAGYGSGRGSFVLSNIETTSGEPFSFVSLEWNNLGLCGARIVSTGQGTVQLLSEDGRRVSPFTEGRDLPALLPSFEAMQFLRAQGPGPASAFGGIFTVESDSGTLAAVFLSQTSP